MQRIAGPTAVNNMFTGGDPSVPRAPTVVTPDWLNAIQEEIVAVILAAQIALDGSNTGQLLTAIRQLIQTAGIAFAADADAIAGTATNLALTPHSGLALVNARLNAVIANAPGALDTLKELADAIGDDANFAATMTAALALRVQTSRKITTTGLLTGGHDLTADLALQVLAAAAADLVYGNANAAANDRAITPQAFSQAGGSNANGYWSYQPGGFIKQWGRAVVAPPGSSSATSSIVFPQAFTDASSISINGNADGGASPGWAPMAVMFPGVPTTVGCAVQIDTANASVKITSSRTVFWQAIGR